MPTQPKLPLFLLLLAAPASAQIPMLNQRLQAVAFVARIQVMVSEGFAELEDARKSRNINRVNCVNDALATMNSLKERADTNFVVLASCASRSAADCVADQHAQISMVFKKTEELLGQAKGCGGPAVDGTIDGRPYIEDCPNTHPGRSCYDVDEPNEELDFLLNWRTTASGICAAGGMYHGAFCDPVVPILVRAMRMWK